LLLLFGLVRFPQLLELFTKSVSAVAHRCFLIRGSCPFYFSSSFHSFCLSLYIPDSVEQLFVLLPIVRGAGNWQPGPVLHIMAKGRKNFYYYDSFFFEFFFKLCYAFLLPLGVIEREK
jgi:hypothetical protein